MTMNDKNIISGKHGGDWWNEDSMEFYVNLTANLDARSYEKGMAQIALSPINLGNTDPSQIKTFGQNSSDFKTRAIIFKTETGWGVEASFPLASTPQHGQEIGFQAHANGASASDRNAKLIWSAADKTDSSYVNPSLFGRALFFRVGSEDVPLASNLKSSTQQRIKVDPFSIVVPAPAITSGQYRNLFAENVIPQSEIDQRIETLWKDLFYGADNAKLFYPVGEDEGYIWAVDSNDVRTEGQSYGMMLAVQLDHQKKFNQIWKWTVNHMQFTEGPDKGYFCWSVRTDGTKNCSNNAYDGEEWFITALFFASNRWGEGQGIFNYKQQAQALLDVARSQNEKGGVSRDLFDRDTKLITFVAQGDAAEYTAPSYQLPHFLELWALWADKDNQFWKDAATAARDFWKKAANPTTGLMSEYAEFDGTPKSVSFNTTANQYKYDARRVQMNVAMDWAWFGIDPWEQMQSQQITDFFFSQGPKIHGSTFTLEGEPLSTFSEQGHTAMIATAGLALEPGDSHSSEFVQYLWDRPTPVGPTRYYNGLLYAFGMLNTSGKFQIIMPAAK